MDGVVQNHKARVVSDFWILPGNRIIPIVEWFRGFAIIQQEGGLTYTFKLDFKSGDVTKGQLPGMMMRVKLGVFGDYVEEAPIVSHECVGPTEWKSEIRRLRDELEVLEAEGLKKINDYHRKVLEKVAP
jgi:hypothetical protein